MSLDTHVQRLDGSQVKITVDRWPDKCPRCHHAITPNRLNGYQRIDQYGAFVTFVCPNNMCDSLFIGQYQQGRHSTNFQLGRLYPNEPEGQSFTEIVIQTSPDFVEFYNQAYKAEQAGLIDICGPGYRKALEFLLKDYLIKNKKLPQNDVSKTKLGECIKKEDWITDSRLKLAAKGATWLGNDHTHYENKHPDSNLDDLKKLIQLTVIWIESEILTEELTRKLEPKKAEVNEVPEQASAT